MGGDRHSHRMEAWAQTILGWIEETPDITLVEMQARLRGVGAPSAMGTLWRLLNRHAMTVKKRLDTLKKPLESRTLLSPATPPSVLWR